MTATLQPQLADLFNNDEIIWEDEILSLYLLPEFDHVEIVKPLRDSIAQIGVQVPILVAQQGTSLTVIDGLRRIVAARAAGTLDIPARVAHLEGAGAAALTIIANSQRSHNEIAEYDAIMRLMTAGHDESAVARMTGMPVGTIRKRLGISHLDPDLMERFRSGQMSAPAAEAAAKLPKARQKALARATLDKSKVRYRDIHDIKQVDAANATRALPSGLFDTPSLPPTPPQETAPTVDHTAQLTSMLETIYMVKHCRNSGPGTKDELLTALNEIEKRLRAIVGV